MNEGKWHPPSALHTIHDPDVNLDGKTGWYRATLIEAESATRSKPATPAPGA